MLFKEISYLELWQPFCSVERKHLCNFGRGYYEKLFCDIILNLDQWLSRKCNLEIFLIYSPGSLFVQRSKIICANFDKECYEEHFCENILNLGQLFRRKCCLKIFVI